MRPCSGQEAAFRQPRREIEVVAGRQRIAEFAGHHQHLSDPGPVAAAKFFRFDLPENRQGAVFRRNRPRQPAEIPPGDGHAELPRRCFQPGEKTFKPAILARRCRQRQQRPARNAAHCGDVAQVALEQFGRNRFGRRRAAMIMHLRSHLIDRRQQPFAAELKHRAIVARPQNHGLIPPQRRQHLPENGILAHDNCPLPCRQNSAPKVPSWDASGSHRC
ncbi:hypothetical protein SDC9_128324 [bioreactor metagenome]|uniref:Uncharacterized protein n=1 Tax=bioreactor metagenome TaxID=1076179 RepID=A0A645CX41_9ZZZZ